MPAYEDAWYYLWRERALPSNVDPLASKLEDKEERARLAKLFDQGLNKVVGYVLPIQRRAGAGPYWISGQWFLRSENLFLIPGDSPIGLRLPLDSMPWVAPTDFPYVHARDPMETLPPLPKPVDRGAHLLGKSRAPQPSIASLDRVAGYHRGQPLSEIDASRPGEPQAVAERIGELDCSHGALRRTARGPLARLYAACGNQ